MSQEDFWIIFSKKLAGEATPQELLELEQLIRQHPEWQYALQNLEDMWHSRQPADTPQAEDAYLHHLQRMAENNIAFDYDQDIDTPDAGNSFSGKRHWRKIYALTGVAACLVLVFFLVSRKSPGIKNNMPASPAMNVISARLGATSNVQLPDGSMVRLNAGSKLTYHKDFGKGNREVTLTGEGFFDVVKDATRPFLIHATGFDIKVLGTAFNVRAYPEDKTSAISLIRGRIEVSLRSRSNDKITLSPHEQLIVNNTIKAGKDTLLLQSPGKPLVSINKLQYNPLDSTVAEIEWINNKLVFNEELFGELAARMERRYGVEIVINDPVLAAKKLTGTFTHETIEQAMEALTITTPFHFERQGNKIIIHR
ncbi:DUF4974 domain-containing protein [Pseudoflavitalea sp. X16]|uniref:FecR domain-containing protein n=1 Tax=Paraflavitalea devenefica TaxID=2716334 RepID=UPI00141DFC7B|nr:FecR domain-containing protein [Paraflavitalea devenefica]NII28024.1 DUF4974 domain-containing protein [Paraflavitalea devenefica]